jgi:uncharacterized membrane protein
MTHRNLKSKSIAVIFVVPLLSLTLAAMTPCAGLAAYVDIIPENIDYLNNPLEDMQFEPRCNLMLSGEFDANTVTAFEEAVRELNARSHLSSSSSFGADLEKQPGFRALCMSSSGGNLHDALALIPHLQDWIAVVPEGAVCESACAIAFMGAGLFAGPYADVGVSSTNRRQARYLHYTGILAFHAPTLDDLPDGPYTKEQVLKAYERGRLTMGRILYLDSWDYLVRKQGDGADTPDLSTTAAIEQTLSSADRDPFLPDSLFFTFLVTPNKSSFRVETVEEALVWGIQISGLSKIDFAGSIPEFWAWRTCENVAWMICHNPHQLSEGCDTIGVTRKIFADASTLPYIVENRETLGIERSVLPLLTPSATIERIAVGNDYWHSHHAYGGTLEQAECGISIYRNKRVIGMRAKYHPVEPSWGFEKLRLSVADDDEKRWVSASRIPPESDSEKIVRPWMWLSMDTRLPDIEKKWSALRELVTTEAKQLDDNHYHILRICNFGARSLTIALGYEVSKSIVTKGWYRLVGADCFVPVDAHTGDTFYLLARDDAGRDVPVPQMVGRKTLCAGGNAPFTAKNSDDDGSCHYTDGRAASLVKVGFSKIVTHDVVTPIVFGLLPKDVGLAPFQRSMLRDVEQGE